jgi:hypothetical protein
MAATANVKISKLTDSQLQGFPVKSGETIYEGALVGLDASDGFIYDLDTTLINQGVAAVFIVAEDSANVTGSAATTADGTISGTTQKASANAGDKTVRMCYTNGKFVMTLSGAAQTSVGKKVYATDNNTLSLTATAGALVGTITAWLGGTNVVVDLNALYGEDGSITIAKTLGTGTGGGGAGSFTNPFGAQAIVDDVVVHVTTGDSSTRTINVGVAANATTDSDNLIDGLSVYTAGYFTSGNSAGTNGKMNQPCTSAQVVTVTPSGALNKSGSSIQVSVRFKRVNI